MRAVKWKESEKTMKMESAVVKAKDLNEKQNKLGREVREEAEALRFAIFVLVLRSAREISPSSTLTLFLLPKQID